MKKYALKNNSGEIISQTKLYSIDEAEEYFSEIKKLGVDDLLKIFTIEEIENI